MKNMFPALSVTALCAVITICAGCGLTKAQKEGIATFGQAAVSLGTASQEELQGGRENVIQMKRLRLAIERKKLPASKPDGSPADRQFYTKELDLDSGLDLDNIERRMDAVDLLIQYGNLLVAFSEETQEKELTAAAAKFTDSVKSFPDNPLSADEINGLGQVVIVAGKFWVEHEKKEALKKVIPIVSPLVKKLCSALENDFDLQKRGVAKNIEIVQDRLASEAIDGLKREGGSIGDRLILIDGLVLADKKKDVLEATTKRILKATASLRQGGEKLVGLIGSDKVTVDEIKTFAADAKDLAKAIKPFLH